MQDIFDIHDPYAGYNTNPNTHAFSVSVSSVLIFMTLMQDITQTLTHMRFLSRCPPWGRIRIQLTASGISFMLDMASSDDFIESMQLLGS